MLEIIVVGGGIAGLAAALALRQRGAAVTVIEAGRPGGGATGASAGMLAAQYEAADDELHLRLCVESRARFSAFAARLEGLAGQDLGLSWPGLLVANRSPEEHEAAEAVASRQRHSGLRAEVLDPGRARELQPGIATDPVSYVWLPDEGQVDTQKLAAAIAPALAAAEVRVIAERPVEALTASGDTVTGVRLVGGRTLEAERIVLAAGAWAGTIGGLPRELPVRPVRGQMLRFAGAAQPLEHIVANRSGRYLVPRTDGTVVAGSTMEDVGFDRSITDDGLRAIHRDVAELLPAFGAATPIERWAGLRPISADSRPVIGPDPALHGLYYATGYGRDGILIAAFAAGVVADLIFAARAEFDWESYSADRFAT